MCGEIPLASWSKGKDCGLWIRQSEFDSRRGLIFLVSSTLRPFIIVVVSEVLILTAQVRFLQGPNSFLSSFGQNWRGSVITNHLPRRNPHMVNYFSWKNPSLIHMNVCLGRRKSWDQDPHWPHIGFFYTHVVNKNNRLAQKLICSIPFACPSNEACHCRISCEML